MKNTLRQEYKLIRKHLTPAEIIDNSNKITTHLFNSKLFKQSQNIMCYLSFKNEVITDDIFTQAWLNHKTMLIPISHTNNHTITLSKLDSFTNLTLSSLGIRELPLNLQQNFSKDSLNLCIIPGIAFDIYGNRLGFGQGYYDRFLAQLPKDTIKIALAFSKQLYQSILPHETFDVKMDYIITENGIFATQNQII